MIGDIGGLQSIIVLLPAQLMSFYASTMLKRSIANGEPSHNQKKKNKQRIKSLASAIVEQSRANGLQENEIAWIVEWLKDTKSKKLNASRALCSKLLKKRKIKRIESRIDK